MFVNYSVDTGGRFENMTIYPLDTAKPTLELPEDFDLKSIRDYVLQGGALIRDPYVPVPSAAEQIAALKQKLAETDYIAAKTVDRRGIPFGAFDRAGRNAQRISGDP